MKEYNQSYRVLALATEALEIKRYSLPSNRLLHLKDDKGEGFHVIEVVTLATSPHTLSGALRSVQDPTLKLSDTHFGRDPTNPKFSLFKLITIFIYRKLQHV